MRSNNASMDSRSQVEEHTTALEEPRVATRQLEDVGPTEVTLEQGEVAGLEAVLSMKVCVLLWQTYHLLYVQNKFGKMMY